MQEADTQDEWTHASQKTPFHVKTVVRVCVRRRLMDGLVYTARGVQRGVGGGCMILGGHGRSDVIDLTGHMSPEEKDADGWIETEM